MGPATGKRLLLAIRWWRGLWAGFLALLTSLRLPRQLQAGTRTRVLPDDLHEQYGPFEKRSGVVADTLRCAVEDYKHLREVVMGPGATVDAVDDVTLLAEAEAALRELLRQAPDLQILVELAGARQADRRGREATGEAMLAFCDRGRALHDLASAALRWASSGRAQDLAHMQACAAKLSGA